MLSEADLLRHTARCRWLARALFDEAGRRASYSISLLNAKPSPHA